MRTKAQRCSCGFVTKPPNDAVLAARARLLAAYFAIVTGRYPTGYAYPADIGILEDGRMAVGTRFRRCGRSSLNGSTTRGPFSLGGFALLESETTSSSPSPVSSLSGRNSGGGLAERPASRLTPHCECGRSRRVDLPEQPACVAAQLAALEGRTDDAYNHAQEALRVSTKAIVIALAEAALGAAELAAGKPLEADAAFSRATVALGSRSGCESRPDFD